MTRDEMERVVDFVADMTLTGMAAHNVATILQAARSYARLQEVRCMGDLTPRQEAAEERHMDAIRLACAWSRHVPFFEGDPRGHTVSIAAHDSPMRQYAVEVPTS